MKRRKEDEVSLSQYDIEIISQALKVACEKWQNVSIDVDKCNSIHIR